MRRQSSSGMTVVWLAVVVGILMGGGSVKADYVFGEPTNLGPVVNGAAHDGGCPSADGLSIFFDSNRAGGQGNWDIWVTTRETTDGEWTAPVNLGAPVNTSAWDGVAIVSPDGLTLYLSSDRPGGSGGLDLYATTRETKEAPWTTPVNLGSTVNSPSDDWSPYISADGLELYFSSTRPGGEGGFDVWMATRVTIEDDWSTPVNLGPGTNSGADELVPSICADGLCFFFCSLRPGGYGSRDIWVMTRATRDDDWSAPANPGPPLNSSSMDQTATLSADGSTVFFLSSRPGGYGGLDLMQVSLTPVVDFNGDGQVDGKEVLMMVEDWGQAESSCDIGPTPFGDGTVDIRDLRVLADYLGEPLDDPTLLAHWALDETVGIVAIETEGAAHGIVTGAAVWQPEGGRVAGALELNGSACVKTRCALDPADGPFSVLAWVKGGSPGQVIVSQEAGANWLLLDPATGALMTELKSESSSAKLLYSDAIIADGAWHRVAFAWDGSRRRLYVDDALVAEDVEDTQDDLTAASGNLTIGAGATLAPDTYWTGLIDDVRIYNRAVRW